MSKIDRSVKKDNDFVVIYKGEGAYMWVVEDNDTHKFWLFYDEETAHEFLYKKKKETGHHVTYGTQQILDLQNK